MAGDAHEDFGVLAGLAVEVFSVKQKSSVSEGEFELRHAGEHVALMY